MSMYIETFKGEGNQPWFFHFKGGNGKVMIASEGYSRRSGRDRAVRRITKSIPGIVVKDRGPA